LSGAIVRLAVGPIEEEFRRPNSGLRVILATTTLAMDVNTPAYGSPYAVAEYKNPVGRAGRLGFIERGTSYLVAMSPREAQNSWVRYVTAAAADLESRFLDADTDRVR
jgi:helicase